MIRPFAALAFLALGLGAAIAQDAAPAAATPEVVVNPTAPLTVSPKQANMLTGFYATQAVIEICALTIDPAILAGMDADRQRLELALGMDVATADQAYAQVKSDVRPPRPIAPTAAPIASASTPSPPSTRPCQPPQLHLPPVNRPLPRHRQPSPPSSHRGPEHQQSHSRESGNLLFTRRSVPYSSVRGIPDRDAGDRGAPHWPRVPARW